MTDIDAWKSTPAIRRDAAITVAKDVLRCRVLLFEVRSHGCEVEGVTISNPFQ